MTTLSMPATTNVFASATFRLIANTRTHTSAFDQSEQTARLTGARWMADFDLIAMKRADAAEWIAFLVELEGMGGRFFGFDPLAGTPRGTNLGTPLINGGSQTGRTLVTDGWTGSQTGALLKGDFFGVNGELKMMTADLDTTAGAGTLNFAPQMRASPADNAPLTTVNATCTMRLVADDAGAWSEELGPFYRISFSGIETF